MSRRIRRTAATILRLFVAASSFPSLPAIPTPLPFPFGIATNDTFPDVRLALPQPMAFLNRNSSFVLQRTDGYIRLEDQGLSFVGFVDIYDMDIDTSRGGQDQNQVWLRVGSNLTDLHLARDIIAGNGTLFQPQAILVATWYKVESKPLVEGAQNTFQLIMVWSATGETWAIYAYSQLEFFANNLRGDYVNSTGSTVQTLFTIRDNATMTEVLKGSNCNRPGIYAIRINQGGPAKAPTNIPTMTPTAAPLNALTKAPTRAPTRARCGLLGWNIFCPFTFCGVFGRWLGLCQSALWPVPSRP